MNEMMPIVNESKEIISSLKNAEDELFVSFETNSFEEKKMLYNATSSNDSLKDMAGKKIKIKDVVIQPVEVKNNDGTTSVVPRSSVICMDGGIYSATSWGVLNSLKKMLAVFGTLHFDEGLDVEVIKIKAKSGETLNLKVI